MQLTAKKARFLPCSNVSAHTLSIFCNALPCLNSAAMTSAAGWVGTSSNSNGDRQHMHVQARIASERMQDIDRRIARSAYETTVPEAVRKHVWRSARDSPCGKRTLVPYTKPAWQHKTAIEEQCKANVIQLEDCLGQVWLIAI